MFAPHKPIEVPDLREGESINLDFGCMRARICKVETGLHAQHWVGGNTKPILEADRHLRREICL